MHLKLQINNLVDLSTVAVTQNSNRSWVKIHSARWVNIQSAITSGVQLDQQDQWGRTLIENAAIANSVDVIGYLFALGADVRNALSLAEKNAKFFPEHQRAVALLKQLKTPN